VTAYILAILSAAFYGAADFVGGLTARRISTIAAVVVTQTSGLIGLVAAIAFFPPASPTTRDLFWGGAAGIMGSVGVALLYAALAIGTMAVVAPITAVCAVAIPVLAVLIVGEPLAVMTGAGIALAMVAIVLISQQPSSGAVSSPRARGLAPGVPQALCSGVAIGFFFLALARTHRDAGMWPLVVSRATSVVLFGGMAKERPYPGSTTVTTVNGGIVGLTRTLVEELKPIRVNSIHPGVVGDSPYWSEKPAAIAKYTSETPIQRLCRMDEIVNAVVFLLENTAVNGVDLIVDGGWHCR